MATPTPSTSSNITEEDDQLTNHTAVRDAERRPTHPGALLRDETLPALSLSVAAAAAHLGVTRQALHRVLAGTAAMSPEMAVRVGKLVGNGPALWLRMQSAYDLWHAERAVDISSIPTLSAA